MIRPKSRIIAQKRLAKTMKGRRRQAQMSSSGPLADALKQVHVSSYNRLTPCEQLLLLTFANALGALVVGPLPDRHDAAEESHFIYWHDATSHAGVLTGPLYIFLFEGLSFKDLDNRFQRRHGWARETIKSCLALWSHTYGQAHASFARFEARMEAWPTLKHGEYRHAK